MIYLYLLYCLKIHVFGYFLAFFGSNHQKYVPSYSSRHEIYFIIILYLNQNKTYTKKTSFENSNVFLALIHKKNLSLDLVLPKELNGVLKNSVLSLKKMKNKWVWGNFLDSDPNSTFQKILMNKRDVSLNSKFRLSEIEIRMNLSNVAIIKNMW